MALSYSAYAVATLVADQFNYLLSNMLLYQMNSIKCSSVLPPRETAKHFIHRFARVTLCARLSSATNCAPMLKKK